MERNVIILFFVMVIIIACFCLWLLRIQNMEMRNTYLKKDTDVMKQHYDEVHDKIDLTRQYRHDLAKHIQMLEYMAKKEGDLPQLFFLMKKQECEKKNIPLQIEMSPPDLEKHIALNGMDFIALMQNLLDNAIEANEVVEGEQKGIILSARESSDFVEFSVGNRYPKGRIIDFKTNKEEKDEHGIGFGIIQDIVKKYGGTMEVADDTEDNWLTIQIEIPLQSLCKE